MESRITAASINSYITNTGADKCVSVARSTLISMLEAYNEIFFELDAEMFQNDPNPDNPQPLVDVLLLVKPPYQDHIDFFKKGCRYLRILSRKTVNYQYFENSCLRVVNIMFSLHDDELSTEVCHVLLRVMSHLPFVRIILKNPEALFQSLFLCLQSKDENLAIAAAAAFQSFAYHQPGKQYICGKNVHVKALSLMIEKSVTSPLFARLLGFLHNMSSEAVVVRSIRESGAISEILEALNAKPISSLTVDAAGLIQNIAREEDSRKRLLDGGVVDSLLNLTVSNDLQAQVRAVGAILNILGPQCDDMSTLKQALSRLIALSALGRAL